MKRSIDYIRNRPLIILNGLFLFLIIEYIIFGKYSFIQIHDFSDDIFPRYIALWNDFIQNGFQYWSLDIGPGMNRLSNLVYYDNLLSLLIAIFPAWLGYQIYILSTTYLGAIGYYKLSTIYFSKTKSLAAIIAIFIPLVLAQINSTGLSCGIQIYPLVLYLIYWINFRIENIVLKLILLILVNYLASIAMSFTLGFVYLMPFMLLWFITVDQIKRSTVILTILAFCVVCAIHYANILSLLNDALESHRAEFSQIASNEGRSYFFYQIPLVLVSVFFIIQKRILDARLLTIFAVFLLITIGDNVLNYLYDFLFGQTPLRSLKISRLGFFSTSFLGFFVLSIADRLNIKQKQFLAIILCLNFFFIAIQLKLHNAEMWVREGNYVANFETKSLNNLRSSDKSLYRVATIYGVTHPNMLSSYGFESADGYSPMYPLRYKHYWTNIIYPMLEQNNDMKRYFLDWGSRFYLFVGEPEKRNNGDRYARYSLIKPREFFNLNLLSIANVKYIISHIPINDDRLEIVSTGVDMSTLNFSDKIKLRLKENLQGRLSIFIYKNLDFIERFRTVGQIKYFSSDKKILAYAYDAPMDELKNTVFMLDTEKEKLSQYNFGHAKTTITVATYSPSKIDFLVKSSGDTMVIISQYLDSNWKCMSNGRRLEIFNAYATFAAIAIKQGINPISCQYYNHNS